MLKWFGSDPNGKGITATIHPQVGGTYEISFEDSNGTQHTCMGKYLVVAKNKMLSFTWEWKNEPGVESLVTIAFKPERSHTTMIFEHKNVGTASAHNYMAGWKATFLKLERTLSDISIFQ